MANINELQNQLEAAQKAFENKQKEMFEDPKIRAFAENLHKDFCKRSHEDFCNWEYENMPTRKGWEESDHQRYLKKAVDLVAKFPNVDFDDLIAIMHKAKNM